tara:strand:+ start:147600 stop:148016 length:417 start_codon:yes stop_codon:yes gene_type:complete
MKKVLFIVAILATSISANAQAKKQLSFGLIGVSYEIPVSSAITLAPTAFTNWDLNHLTVGAKANYYFDDLIELPSQWDFYAGANAGYALAIGNNQINDFHVGFQLGGRFFWSDKWGIYLEGGAGNLGGDAGIGLTMVL